MWWKYVCLFEKTQHFMQQIVVVFYLIKMIIICKAPILFPHPCHAATVNRSYLFNFSVDTLDGVGWCAESTSVELVFRHLCLCLQEHSLLCRRGFSAVKGRWLLWETAPVAQWHSVRVERRRRGVSACCAHVSPSNDSIPDRDTLVAALPDAGRYTVISWTGGPGVRLVYLGSTARLISSFSLRVQCLTSDCLRRYVPEIHFACCGDVKSPHNH